MSETELRRLRERVSARNHYEDALRAHYGKHVTDNAIHAWAEYLSFVYEAHHVGTCGIKRPGQAIDTGAMESAPPSYDPRAMALYKSERRWMDGAFTAWMGVQTKRVSDRLDSIVGEAAE